MPHSQLPLYLRWYHGSSCYPTPGVGENLCFLLLVYCRLVGSVGFGVPPATIRGTTPRRALESYSTLDTRRLRGRGVASREF